MFILFQDGMIPPVDGVGTKIEIKPLDRNGDGPPAQLRRFFNQRDRIAVMRQAGGRAQASPPPMTSIFSDTLFPLLDSFHHPIRSYYVYQERYVRKTNEMTKTSKNRIGINKIHSILRLYIERSPSLCKVVDQSKAC